MKKVSVNAFRVRDKASADDARVVRKQVEMCLAGKKSSSRRITEVSRNELS